MFFEDGNSSDNSWF